MRNRPSIRLQPYAIAMPKLVPSCLGHTFQQGSNFVSCPRIKMSQRSSGHAKTSVLQTALLAAVSTNKSCRHESSGTRAAKYLSESLEFQEAWKTSDLFKPARKKGDESAISFTKHDVPFWYHQWYLQKTLSLLSHYSQKPENLDLFKPHWEQQAWSGGPGSLNSFCKSQILHKIVICPQKQRYKANFAF